MSFIRLMIISFLALTLLGCNDGSKGSGSNTYQISLQAAPAQNQGLYKDTNALPYDDDELITVTISGGSVSDADFPKDITLVNVDTAATSVNDFENCYQKPNAAATCVLKLHNMYAGPSADKPEQLSLQVSATSDGKTISSNAVPLTLIGQQSACADTLCLSTVAANPDKYGKSGYYHTGLVYQVRVSVGNPAKVGAQILPPGSVTFNNIKFSGQSIAVLNATCSADTAYACTYDLQNQNLSATYTDATLQATADVVGATQGPGISNSVALNLPQLSSCTTYNNQGQAVAGVSLQYGAISDADIGVDPKQPLIGVPQSDYMDTNKIELLYPESISGYQMNGHVVAITDTRQPYLFSAGANKNIPGSSGGSNLNENSCDELRTKLAAIYPKSHDHEVDIPIEKDGVTQQCDEHAQTRFAYYAVPNGNPPSAAGWPVVIMLHGWDGQDPANVDGSYQLKHDGSPVYDNTSENDMVFSNDWDWSVWGGNSGSTTPGGNSGNQYNHSNYVRMRLLQALLAHGYAVIVPFTWNAGDFDSWAFEPGYDRSDATVTWPYTTNNWPAPPIKNDSEPKLSRQAGVDSMLTYLYNGYWPGFDKQFFEALMTKVMDPQGFDSANTKINTKMDYNNLFLFGYSAGANMVSRLINEFPDMYNTNGVKFPTIKGAIVLSGGSYACYSEDYNACPAVTEQRYDSSVADMEQHPPTLLAQALYDDYAPTYDSVHAGTAYYNRYVDVCTAPTGQCKYYQNPEHKVYRDGGADGMQHAQYAPYEPDNLIQIVHTANMSVQHSYFPEMIIPSLNLMLKHTCVPLSGN